MYPLDVQGHASSGALHDAALLSLHIFAHAVRASLNFCLVWADMFCGAASQYLFGIIDSPTGRMTRYTALTGTLFDV